jgi:hypothetical protein
MIFTNDTPRLSMLGQPAFFRTEFSHPGVLLAAQFGHPPVDVI